MREVKYERPADFVDPFAPVPVEEPLRRGRRVTAEAADGSSPVSPSKSPGASLGGGSASHVHRVRNIKQERAGHDEGRKVRKSGEGSPGPRLGNASSGALLPARSGSGEYGVGTDGFEDEDDDGEYEEDDYDEDEDYPDEFKELLSETKRDIRISEEVLVHPHHRSHHRDRHHVSSSGSVISGGSIDAPETKLNMLTAMADVKCWLVNGEFIVLSAVVLEDGRHWEAEAEISLDDLAVLRGEEPVLNGVAMPSAEEEGGAGAGGLEGDSLSSQAPAPVSFDMATLQAVATEMAAHVELRIDLESCARLILNLVSEEDPALLGQTGGPSEADFGDLMSVGGGGSSVGGLSRGSAGGGGASAAGGAGRGGADLHHQHHSAQHLKQQQSSLLVDSLVSEQELGDMLIDGTHAYIDYTFLYLHL
jgi:hypothetical protein